MEKKKVIRSEISTGSFNECINYIFSLTESKRSSYVCFANVHMIIEAYKDSAFNKALSEADVVTPDGRPLSIFMNFFYKIKQERIPGMDLLPKLLEEAEKRGKSVFFYGSTNDTLDLIADRIRRELPGLEFTMYSPPFRPLTPEEKEADLDRINKANPDLLFVSLGCPRQEKWMAEHNGKVNACMLGVGQAFNTYAGIEKRLPKWMRGLALEWAYRLYLEPKRLWRRYLVCNSLFIYLVFKRLVWRKRYFVSANQ